MFGRNFGFGIGNTRYQPKVSANLSFGFSIGPKPKYWFRSYTRSSSTDNLGSLLCPYVSFSLCLLPSNVAFLLTWFQIVASFTITMLIIYQWYFVDFLSIRLLLPKYQWNKCWFFRLMFFYKHQYFWSKTLFVNQLFDWQYIR